MKDGEEESGGHETDIPGVAASIKKKQQQQQHHITDYSPA